MTARPRCCLCRTTRFDLEPTELPGSGFRCIDPEACKRRVALIVSAHKAWAAI
jgi:hypothetical protein